MAEAPATTRRLDELRVALGSCTPHYAVTNPVVVLSGRLASCTLQPQRITW